MIERVTLFEGKKVKKIVEIISNEEDLEAIKSKAALVMLKNRLENTIKQIESNKT